MTSNWLANIFSLCLSIIITFNSNRIKKGNAWNHQDLKQKYLHKIAYLIRFKIWICICSSFLMIASFMYGLKKIINIYLVLTLLIQMMRSSFSYLLYGLGNFNGEMELKLKAQVHSNKCLCVVSSLCWMMFITCMGEMEL